MKYFRKTDRKALLGTLLVHAVLVALLFWLTLSAPQQEMLPQEGVPVLLGNVEDAFGQDDPGFSQESEAASEEAAPADVEISQPASEKVSQQVEKSAAVPAEKSQSSQPLITQKEKSVALAEKKAAEEAAAKRRAAEEARRREQEEAEARARAEAARKAEAERRAAQAASDRVKNRFGTGASAGSSGITSGSGTQGIPSGNSRTGQPVASLPGRSPKSLPLPAYPGNEEGDVVVRITVNAAGRVVSASIQTSGTNTSNAALRSAALAAARRATFNAVSGAPNITGKITYRFRLQ